MEVMIKHRLFTWFEEVDSSVQPGTKVLTERIAHLGEVVDIPSDNPHLQRGKDLDSFFSESDRKKVEDGSYRGPGWEHVTRMRAGVKPQSMIEDADGEGFQTDNLTVEELAEYIKENRLTVQQTVDLARDGDLESIERVLDAEDIASDNSPRKGVVEVLEVKLQAVSQS